MKKSPSHNAAQQLEARVWKLLNSGETREAIRACRELNQRFPRYGHGWYSASQLAARLGNYGLALQAVESALQLEPGNRGWQLQQANCLMRLGRNSEARPLVLALDQLELPSAYQCATLGLLLSRLDLQAEALKHYQRALRLEPGEANNYYNLATVQRFLGNLDAADNALAQALQLDPADGEAWRLRADLKRWSEEENHLAELEQVLAGESLQPRARIQVHHALAKELEDLGRWQASFSQLKAGADLRRRHMQYNLQGDIDTLGRIAEVYDADWFSTARRGCDNDEPIFVLGMPRTGTTLVERILGSHSQVYAAGELNDFALSMSRAVQALVESRGQAGKLDKLARVGLSAELDFAGLGQAYVDATRPATAGLPRFVDKLPLNFLYCGLIHSALPAARIVHLRRHPMDACYAIYKTLFADAYPFSYSLEELARYYIAYHELMQHWHRVMPGVIHDIHYEQLVAEQEDTTRSLLTYCKLPFETSCLDFHANRSATTTASASQVRQPIYASSVGKWRHFQRELEPLAQLLVEAGIDID